MQEAPRSWLKAAWLLVVSRVGLGLVAYFGLVLFPLVGLPDQTSRQEPVWRGFPANMALDGWARWDSGWYKLIAERGYGNAWETRFFPLYPLLMRSVSVVTGDTLLAGMLISNLSFVGAGLLLYWLARDRFGDQVAWRTMVLLCTFPFTFFFGAVYTESLFLLTAVASFYLGERGRWVPASLCAALAAIVRVPGFLVAVGLAILYFEKIGFQRRRIRPDIVALALTPTLLALHLCYLQHTFGDPLVFARGHVVEWRGGTMAATALTPIGNRESLLSGRFRGLDLLNAIALGVGFLSCAVAFFRMSKAAGLWGLSTLLISLLAWQSGGRYVCPLFFCYVIWARLLPSWVLYGAAYVSLQMAALLTLLFTHWVWVG